MVITTPGFDERYSNNNQYPIARGHRGNTLQVTVPAGQTSSTKTFAACGQLLGFVYEAPDLATDTTFDVDFVDLDGVSWHKQTGVPDNGKGIVWIIDTKSRFLAGQHKLVISFATAQGSDVTFVIVPILK